MHLEQALGLDMWNMQTSGAALCPRSGVNSHVTQEGERAVLALRSGWQTIFDARRGGLLIEPAVRRVDGVTLRAVSAWM